MTIEVIYWKVDLTQTFESKVKFSIKIRLQVTFKNLAWDKVLFGKEKLDLRKVTAYQCV